MNFRVVFFILSAIPTIIALPTNLIREKRSDHKKFKLDFPTDLSTNQTVTIKGTALYDDTLWVNFPTTSGADAKCEIVFKPGTGELYIGTEKEPYSLKTDEEQLIMYEFKIQVTRMEGYDNSLFMHFTGNDNGEITSNCETSFEDHESVILSGANLNKSEFVLEFIYH